MIIKVLISIILACTIVQLKADAITDDSLRWGNVHYFNMHVGDSIIFNDTQVILLDIRNHYNLLLVGNDTLWLKVSRRTLPQVSNGIRIFVADNKNVKQLTSDPKNHGLLTKDALVCLSDFRKPLLDPADYAFPISFNDGYLWGAEENSHMFSYLGEAEWIEDGYYRSHEGIDFDMHDARGKEKHWLVAIENSRVVWIKDKGLDEAGKEACVLLESESQPGIYYIYKHLYNENVVIKEGQRLMRGEPIGTIWGDHIWGHLHFAVVHSDSVPVYKNRYHNLVNAFPQVYELYFTYFNLKTFTRGRILFGRLRSLNRNEKNANAYEAYSGKGWITGEWNTADKMEWAMRGEKGNVRIAKTLFMNSPAACINPDDYYDYELNVKNGTYRISAQVGDVWLPSWQKVIFENIDAGTYDLNEGKQVWTPERVVTVADSKLTIRIFVDSKNKSLAGISEIVFQRVN